MGYRYYARNEAMDVTSKNAKRETSRAHVNVDLAHVLEDAGSLARLLEHRYQLFVMHWASEGVKFERCQMNAGLRT